MFYSFIYPLNQSIVLLCLCGIRGPGSRAENSRSKADLSSSQQWAEFQDCSEILSGHLADKHFADRRLGDKHFADSHFSLISISLKGHFADKFV